MPFFNLLPKIRNLIFFTPTLIIKFSVNEYDAFYYCTFLVRFFTTVDNEYRKGKLDHSSYMWKVWFSNPCRDSSNSL